MPNFEEINGGSGRSIEGLPVVQENFSLLREGRDYSFVLLNPYIVSSGELKDFVYFVNPGAGEIKKEIAPPHWRATAERGVLSRAVIPFAKDKRPVPFFTVGVKGVGYLKPSVLGKNLGDYETWISEDTTPGQEGEVKVLGISDKVDYFFYRNQNIMDRSIFLTSQGLRTELYWGVEKNKEALL